MAVSLKHKERMLAHLEKQERTKTRADLIRTVIGYERMINDPMIEHLIIDLLEVTYQQGKVDGINELALRIGASVPKADDVPAPCADGFQGGRA